MIVSHKHKFIFMHSLKTAGSSLTIALQPYLGEEDYLSIDPYVLDDFRSLDIVPKPFFSEKRAALLTSEGFVKAGEFMRQALEMDSFKGLSMSSRAFFSRYKKSSLYDHVLRQHGQLKSVRNTFSDEFSEYFKFAVERHPFEKLKSLYKWRWSDRYAGANATRPSFKDFVLSIAGDQQDKKMKRSFAYSSFPIYAIGDEVAVDKLGNYAELRAFIKEIEGELGLGLLNAFPEAKRLGSTGEGDLEFDQDMQEVVFLQMSRELSLFSGWR